MGVAIFGFAAYRDDTGKLCTFEYVIPSLVLIYLTEIQLSFSFSTKDPRLNTFTQTHPKEIEQFLATWGKWVSQNGNES